MRSRLWRLTVATVFGLVSAAVVAGPAQAASTTITVDRPNGHVETFQGTVRSDGHHIPNVPECVNTACKHVKLTVDLPGHVWANKPGGVLVAIKFDQGVDDNLGLVVYRNGTRVAASTAQVATAQAIRLDNAANGVYNVYVVDGVSFGASAPNPIIHYEGLAQVTRDPAVRPVRDLLPDLVALPQGNITFDNPGDIFDDPSPAGSSCHQSEGASLCLRFDQNLANVGEGPLEIGFDLPTGTVPVDEEEIPTHQRIYRSDGTHYDVPAGTVEWHKVHRHWHFVDFAWSLLWATDAAGNRLGASPVATGNKVSFCIADTAIHPDAWGSKAGFAPSGYPAPDCLQPRFQSGGRDYLTQGMRPGHADKYDWFLPGQFVEVTGVPDGDYILDTIVDPTGRLRQINTGNNCGSVRVRLAGMTTTTPHAELLGVGPACTH